MYSAKVRNMVSQAFVKNWVQEGIILLAALYIINFFMHGQLAFTLGDISAMELLGASIIAVIIKKYVVGSGESKLVTFIIVSLGEILLVLVIAGFIDGFIGFPILSVFVAVGIVQYAKQKV